MTTDFRALCARMADLLNRLHSVVWAEASQLLNEDSEGSEELDLAIEDALTSARAALAATEQGPSEAELKTFACKWWHSFGFVKDKATCGWVIDSVAPEHFADFSRDVLARWGRRPAVEPVQGPTEADLFLKIDALLDGIDRDDSDPKGGWWETGDGAKFGRIKLRELKELIAEYQQGSVSVEPVPVAERLPGPEDCDDQGRCWLGTPGSGVMDAYWVYRKAEHRRSWDTHWAPYWAFPVPQEAKQ